MIEEQIPEVQKYSSYFQELKYSQKHKVEQILNHNCLEYDAFDKVFYCNPILGYNSTKYLLHNKTVDGSFICTCQGFMAKLKKGEKPFCSHIGALMESFHRGKFQEFLTKHL